MTAKKRKTIVIIEASDMIQQGLPAILHDSMPDVDCVAFHDISELHLSPPREIGLVIMNCALAENHADVLDASLQHIPVIGLVTNLFVREHAHSFTELIYLTDRAEKISNIVKKHFYNQLEKQPRQDVKLTSRETEVLELLIKGYSNKQISSELHISIHTVITHRQNITTKLDIKSIAGLTIYGVINNIIDIDDYLEH